MTDRQRFRLEVAAATSLDVRLSPPSGHRRGAVLYLHGFGSSCSGEKAELLRRRFNEHGWWFCGFDFRGHGTSDGSMLDLTLSRHLADTEAVHHELERRGLGPTVIVGSSIGGLTGLWHAARHPARVAAAAHLAPALGLESTFGARLGDDAVRRWERDGRLEIAHELGSWEVGWGFVEDLRAHLDDELADGYRTPTLLLQGMLDDSVAWRRVVDFAAACEGRPVELHLFADGDHRMIDRLERLAGAMTGFLAAFGDPPA